MPLSESDLEAIQRLLNLHKEELLQLMDERFGKMPSREEFFAYIEQVSGDIESVKQEQTMQAHRLRDHEDRIQILEDSEAKA